MNRLANMTLPVDNATRGEDILANIDYRRSLFAIELTERRKCLISRPMSIMRRYLTRLGLTRRVMRERACEIQAMLEGALSLEDKATMARLQVMASSASDMRRYRRLDVEGLGQRVQTWVKHGPSAFWGMDEQDVTRVSELRKGTEYRDVLDPETGLVVGQVAEVSGYGAVLAIESETCTRQSLPVPGVEGVAAIDGMWAKKVQEAERASVARETQAWLRSRGYVSKRGKRGGRRGHK